MVWIGPDVGADPADPAPPTVNATANTPAPMTANALLLNLLMNTPCGQGPSARAYTSTNWTCCQLQANRSKDIADLAHQSLRWLKMLDSMTINGSYNRAAWPVSIGAASGFEPRTYALRELGFPINLLNFHLDSLDTFEGF